jgi:hypothetical protein
MLWLLFIGLVLTSSSCPFGGDCTPPFISKGQGYKEGNWVGYNLIPTRTLSLLAHFTYIFIDIIIYALRSTPWSSRIFWMVDWVIADPSLGLPSLCGMVPQVPILISSPWVFGKWVDAGWSESSLSVTNFPSTQSKYSSKKSLSAFSPNWSNRCTY